MRWKVIKTLAILGLAFVVIQVNAQCKLKMISDSLYSTSEAELGGGNSSAFFSIMKTGSSFILKLEYARGFAKKMTVNKTTPLIFKFKNDATVKLYPIMQAETEAGFDVKYKYAFIGASEISSLYPISIEQMEQLKDNLPEEINFYYYLKSKKTDTQENWQLLHYDWHYKRIIKILTCALENK